MTSHKDKCGLSSLLSMSCERAEAFTDRFRTRLASLSPEKINEGLNENSWLSSYKDSLTLSQPKHKADYNTAANYSIHFINPASFGEDTKDVENELITKTVSSGADQNKNCQVQSKIMQQDDSDSSNDLFYDCAVDHKELPNSVYENDSDNVVEEEPTENSESIHLNSDLLNTEPLDIPTIKPPDILPEELHTENTFNTSQSISPTGKATLQVDLQSAIDSLHDKIDEDNVSEDRIARVRRCSSLKTGKTPPGTPGRQKIVRFADVLGLDLADVRIFLDDIPWIPNSAFNDLACTNSASNTPQKVEDTKILIPLFQQPGGESNFIDRVRRCQVSLETAFVDDTRTFSIKGIVRVKNLDFHKTVHIRYTLDSWQSFVDTQAVYIENSCDGFSDKFSFVLNANNMVEGKKLEFAIRFQCKGCQFWDNNNGLNYCFQCLPKESTSTAPIDDEGATFY